MTELFDVLVLGDETEVGKKIIKKLLSVDRNIEIYIQAKKRKSNLFITKQIFIDMNNEKSIHEALSKFKVIVQCSRNVPKKVTEVIKQIVEADYIDATINDSEVVIEAMKLKFPSRLDNVCAFECVGILDGLTHFNGINFKPKSYNGMAVIECSEKSNSRHFIKFRNILCAYLFLFFAVIGKILPFIKEKTSCDWFFTGINDEGDESQASAYVTDFLGLESDLAVHTVIKSLRFKGWFDLFNDMQIRVI